MYSVSYSMEYTHGTYVRTRTRNISRYSNTMVRTLVPWYSSTRNTWILDVGVVCPGTQRYVDQGSGTTPGLAAEAYAAVKVAKYADQDNFIPFILETGGRVNKAARDWLDALTLPSQASKCPARTTSRGTRRRGRPLRPS